MYTRSALITWLIVVLLCGSGSGFGPFKTFVVAQLTDSQNVKQVAIIGAGAAGASTAYHLEKLANTSGVPINITVYERSSYVGGRSTTVNAFDDPLEPVELGASIFVQVNEILTDAVDEFELHPLFTTLASDDPEFLGIWNGQKFVFTQKDGGWKWWQTAKIIWQYGLAPIRTQRLMKSTVGKFLQLYDEPFFPFRSLSDRVLDLGLTPVTSMTGQQYLDANKIGPPFTTDIIQASTRVNYGQNLGVIHGLETMVCMATEGAMQVKGGNWQIFSNMLNASKASVFLNTTVSRLIKETDKYTLQISPTSDSPETQVESSKNFDTVVLAAPLQFSGIELTENMVKHVPDEIPYVKLHVTLFSTPLRLSGSYFNLKEGEEVPTTVLTTLSPDDDPSSRHNMVGKTGFFSISTLRSIINPKTKQKEYIYKIFSPEKVNEYFLSNLFGIQVSNDVSIFNTSAGGISWYYPHVWRAYPVEYPRVTFEDPELARGFYYTAGIESFISTMETSALMGKNVAQLIMDDYLEVQDTLTVQDGSTTQKVPAEEL